VRNNLTGKILRINVNKSCAGKHYCIPSSNPYAHSTKYRREIIAWGLRNPWRVSIDRPTNTLWIGDVGQDRYEEIDHVGVPAAHDFGWSCKEGRTTYNAGECDHRHITGPVQVIPHSPGGNCAIIGGYVYRGLSVPELYGEYVFGDLCSGQIWSVTPQGAAPWPAPTLLPLSAPSLNTFGEDSFGELYLATGDGNFSLVAPTATPAASIAGITPSSGINRGGQPVTIAGGNFTRATQVFFGNTRASGIDIQNPTTLTAFAPPGAGIVAVSVVNPGTAPAVLPAAFTYTPIERVAPPGQPRTVVR
jgi:hypothetical protein